MDYLGMGRALIEAVASYEDKITVMQLLDTIQELQRERDELSREVAELRRVLVRKKRLETVSGASWVLEDDGTMTGPVCKACYDRDDLVIRLVSTESGARCPNCKREYPGVEASVPEVAHRVKWV